MNGEFAKLAMVMLGGSIGAGLRFLASEATHSIMGRNFPYGTLAVNVIGSLIIGYLLVLLPEGEEPIPHLRLLLITGVLGGFTTYSAFSVETLQLIQDGELGKAGMNIMLTLLACFLAVWVGYAVSRWAHGSH